MVAAWLALRWRAPACPTTRPGCQGRQLVIAEIDAEHVHRKPDHSWRVSCSSTATVLVGVPWVNCRHSLYSDYATRVGRSLINAPP
jgi:hypothetical protein